LPGLVAPVSALPVPVRDSYNPASANLHPALRGALAPPPKPLPGVPAVSFFPRRNELGFFASGNFNPLSNILIPNTPHLAVSSNKSSMGAGIEYRRWISNRNALGLLYTQNDSDGKLLWQGQSFVWPMMRYDLSVLATQRFMRKKIAPFLCEGPGVVITNGYANSGWTAGFAFVAGLGTDYNLGSRFSARTGVTLFDTKSGCYDDPTCRASWGVATDLRVGLAYRWGF
jgi:hypothetical protein